MTEQTLIKANDLRQKIRSIKDVLDSFYWDNAHLVSKRPVLIIECDDEDGRVENRLPIDINHNLIGLIKEEATKQLLILEEEFQKL